MKETFGEFIRKLRKKKHLIIRKAASELDIDPATLSKYERGERPPAREHLNRFAKFYEVDEEELLIIYLSDKIVFTIIEEKDPDKILEVSQQKLKYLQGKNFKQGTLNF